jgi:hypothetical protein
LRCGWKMNSERVMLNLLCTRPPLPPTLHVVMPNLIRHPVASECHVSSTGSPACRQAAETSTGWCIEVRLEDEKRTRHAELGSASGRNRASLFIKGGPCISAGRRKKFRMTSPVLPHTLPNPATKEKPPRKRGGFENHSQITYF